jgi:RNA polymerase sigma factor FliA
MSAIRVAGPRTRGTDATETDGSGGRSDTVEGAADELWSRYWQDRSRENRNRLVIFYAPLVTIVARRFARRARSLDSLEELCSFGRFGLIDAVEKWDASAGFQFATYATKRIQGAIIDELRRDDFLPRRLRARVQIYYTTCEDLEARLRRSPTIQEIAAELNIEVAEAIELRGDATSLTHLAPLAEGNEGAEGRSLNTATAHPTPSQWVESLSTHESIKQALLRLSERQRQVIVLYFLEGLAKSEVADVLGVDRSRVTQLLQQGLRNLRVELGLDQVADADALLPDPSSV